MSNILITCPTCRFQRNVPKSKIPKNRVKVKCPSCKNSFIINIQKEINTVKADPDGIPSQLLPSNRSHARLKAGRSSTTISGSSEKHTPPKMQKYLQRKKQLQTVIMFLLIITICLVPVRIWLSKKSNSTPYPYWLCASKHGLAILYGDHFYVVDYDGNIQWSEELPDTTVPCQILWQGGDIWISDLKNDCILQFHDGSITEILLNGPEICGHLNVAVCPFDQKLYITDSMNHSVKIYSDSGEYEGEFGRQGLLDGDLFWPKDIAFNDTGMLIIGNSRRPAVDVFETDGTFVETLVKLEYNPDDFINGNILPPILADFVIDNKNLITLECDGAVTFTGGEIISIDECKIASYDNDGNLNGIIPHIPGREAGDIAMWEGLLYVSNILKRGIDVYDAATLSHLGIFSTQIDEIGKKYSESASLCRILSRLSLLIMILSFILVIWMYTRMKRSPDFTFSLE